MSQQTLIAMLITSAAGYAMVFSGLAKRALRLGRRGRCPRCGRVRAACSCRQGQ